MESAAMRVLGKVKWFDVIRGFGMIGRMRGEADCVVHHSAVRGTVHHALGAGESVEFEVVQGGGGATARDVVRLGVALLPAVPEGI
jgi:CspA family cold shock protein